MPLLCSNELYCDHLEYGFMRLEAAHEAELHQRLKPRYDSGCVFMYQML